jgi:Tfp pilus assembly protein PilW
MYLAQTLEQLGHYNTALDSFDRAIHLSGGSTCITAMKAHTLASAGDHTTSRRILAGLTSSSKLKCVPSFDIAAAHAALGDSAQSIHWLNRASSEHHMRLYSLARDPRFAQLSTHTSFRQLVQDLGLPA